MSALTFEQKIGLSRAPTSGRILWHSGALGRAPDVEDRIHERPGGFNAVAAIEECGVAADTVVQKRRVGAARRISKTFAIAEIHGDVADAHFRARALCAERNGNAFIGLDIQDEAVGLNLFFAEDDVRSAAELDHDLRGALSETLAGTKIKGDACPAPVVDQQFASDKGFGFGSGIHVGLFAVAGHRLITQFSGRVLSANHGLRHHFQIEGADGLQNLQFFIADGGGIKRGGRLNRNQRGELENVALNHVAEGAGGFIKTAAALDTERFRCGDLHVINVIAIPKRLEDAVAKAQYEKVLHRVFAEVVIDAVDLLLIENVENNLIQGLG